LARCCQRYSAGKKKDRRSVMDFSTTELWMFGIIIAMGIFAACAFVLKRLGDKRREKESE